jgi:ketosteroid isomerase-like protein
MRSWRKTHEGPRAAQQCRPRATWRALPWLAAAFLLAGCGEPPSEPEARIRAALAEAEAAAQGGDFDALAARVARDYADRAGRDRRTLLLTLRGLLMRYPRLELIVTIREIEILSPQLARVRLELLAAGAGPAGMSADAFPVELSLRDEGGGWKVTRAEWGRRFGDGI